MTFIGDNNMYSQYLEHLRELGKVCFTSNEVRKELRVSDNSAKCGLSRLKKSGKVVSPVSGLYVIVPPEYRPYGCIPPQDLVPLIMKYLKADYYVGLLSAGTFYGATHQKPGRFQVISNKEIKHSLQFGQIAIELIYKKSLANLPLKDFTVKTGYLKVGSPELTAIDLFKYPLRAAGISHIATVLSELVESMDADKLIMLAECLGELHQVQRIGYVVEKIDVMDDEQKNSFIVKLEDYLKQTKRPYVPLVPYMPKTGHSRCKRWRIIENTDFESDL
jgi:predicted transcriptional regulator of viral defense system